MIKKTLTIFLLLTILIPGIIRPHPAEAGLDDVVEKLANAADAITGGMGFFVDFFVKTAVEVAKKRLLDAVVDQIIVSIEGGGQPMFVQDWKGFLEQYVNVATGDVVEALGLGAVCRPFGIQLQLALFQPPRFSNQITCTLDQIVGNIVNFYEDFRHGGFIAYREIWQPQNNFYGALLMAMNEKNKRIFANIYAATQEAAAGSGYLGIRKCDATGRFCYIQTPGTQVGALLAKAYGSKIDWLINTRDLAGYTAAVADALIIRLTREGVFALRSYAQDLPSSQEIYARATGEIPDDRDRCANLTGTFLEDCRAAQIIEEGNLQSNRRALINQINLTLRPLQSAEESLRQSLAKQESLVNGLTELRQCQLGRGQQRGDTETELETANNQLGSITLELSDINSITTSILNTRLELENPPTPNVLTQIFRQAEPLLNPPEANRLKIDKQAQLTTITAQVNPRLQKIPVEIQRCANN